MMDGERYSGKFHGVWLDDLTMEHIEAMTNAYKSGYDDGYAQGVADSIKVIDGMLRKMEDVMMDGGNADVAG